MESSTPLQQSANHLEPKSSDHRRGELAAPALLLMYGDFECDHCRAAYAIIEEVLQSNPASLCFIFRHFPLTSVHGHAQKAAEVSEAANAQGRFWNMYNLLFKSNLDEVLHSVEAFLEAAGLDVGQAVRELDSGAYHAIVRQQFRSGVSVGVNATPTLFINGNRYDGELSSGALNEALFGTPNVVSIGKSKTTKLLSLPSAEFIEAVSTLSVKEFSPQLIERAFEIAKKGTDAEVAIHAALLLAELFPVFSGQNEMLARKSHELIMRLSKQGQQVLFSKYLNEQNMPIIPWQNEREVIEAAQLFLESSESAFSVRELQMRVSALVKFACRRFIRNGAMEQAFLLLLHLPIPSEATDSEGLRIRNTLNLYENRRIEGLRRRLLGALMAALVIVFIIAPTLFHHFENQLRLSRGVPTISYWESIYWSIITFATVGYGDIVPLSHEGKIMAVCLALSGVIVMGIVAGLILNASTQRKL